jgi:PEP-CTERM motif-containing protein
MGIRFRATGIAIGLLLALMVRPAKADTWHATGQTDFAYCAATRPGWCSSDSVSYALDLTTGPPVLDTGIPNWQRVYLFISSISGQVNGIPMSCTESLQVVCGDLIASQVNYSGPPRPDQTIGPFGSGSIFGYPGTDPVSIAFGDSVSGFSRSYVSWNIVSTPEPSTLLLLGMALLGLIGLKLLKDRLI